MLIIRKEQIELFEKASAPHFPMRLGRLLAEQFPTECAALGEDGLRRVVEQGIQRADSAGFTTQNGAHLFTDLLFRIGWGFDKDPQLPWVAPILTDPELSGEKRKAQRLSEEMAGYQERVLGPAARFKLEACKRFASEQVEGFPTGIWFEGAVRERLQTIWPEKCEFLGEQRIVDLIRRGSTAAQARNVGTGSGPFICVALMFLLGSSFDLDPIHPWAGRILCDDKDANPDSRARRLREAACVSLMQRPVL